MRKNKEYWDRFCKLVRTKVFLLTFPAFAFAVTATVPPRIIGCVLFTLWAAVIIANVEKDEEER